MGNARILTLCLLMVATGGAVAGLTSQTVRGGDQPDEKPSAAEAHDNWEYLVVAGGTTNTTPTGYSSMRKEPAMYSMRESFPVESNLDKLGAKGWELVSVGGTPNDPVYYFKRRK